MADQIMIRRLAGLRAGTDGEARFASEQTHTGDNEFGDLGVTLSPDQRVVDVTVHRTDGLRTNEQLQSALSEAVAAAELARLRDSLEAAGQLERYAQSDEVARPVRIPVVPPGPRHGPPSRREREERAARDVRTTSPVRGTSENGYLTLTLLGSGPGVWVEADELWLSAAAPARLAAALRQAFFEISEELR